MLRKMETPKVNIPLTKHFSNEPWKKAEITPK